MFAEVVSREGAVVVDVSAMEGRSRERGEEEERISEGVTLRFWAMAEGTEEEEEDFLWEEEEEEEEVVVAVVEFRDESEASSCLILSKSGR